MPISDKTRKILWATSGNLCAMCKTMLVIGASESDSASIVGDECHIRSKSEIGPRYDACYPKTELDENENLLLLCKKDHKLIDDQVNKFSTIVLEKLKSDHESYVKTKIHIGNAIPEVKIVRIKDQIPKYLPEIQSGNVLANIIENCHAQLPKYCDGLDDEETEIIGAFFGNLADYADIYSEIGILEKMRAAKDIERENEQPRSKLRGIGTLLKVNHFRDARKMTFGHHLYVSSCIPSLNLDSSHNPSRYPHYLYARQY